MDLAGSELTSKYRSEKPEEASAAREEAGIQAQS